MVSTDPIFLGIDFGTSGVRISAIDSQEQEIAFASHRYSGSGTDIRDPRQWWSLLTKTFGELLGKVDGSRITSISVDGTSGTLVPVNEAGCAIQNAIMYNDPCTDRQILDVISKNAPPISAAHGASSGLARAIKFRLSTDANSVLHQADWISNRLSGRFATDENNALKTGYDPLERCWPEWVYQCGLDHRFLPEPFPAGKAIGTIRPDIASEFGISKGAIIVAGTTDGCASFLATGANKIGEATTVLGTTITVKIVSKDPIFSPKFGIYSHRIANTWLAGGASNSGGIVLDKYFSLKKIEKLSGSIDVNAKTGLDYYPLARKGERFPVADPDYPPRIDPIPDDNVLFLQGLFEGMASIEKLGFQRLEELGGPKLISVRTVGGGAKNEKWSQIRCRVLGVQLLPTVSIEASYGTALLAKRGWFETDS